MSTEGNEADSASEPGPVGDRLEYLYLPLLLTLASFVLFVGFQSIQLWQERDALAALKAGQESSIQEGQRLRQQLDKIAGQTARLASEGHLVARAIIDDLRRQGVTINPGVGTASP